MILELTNTRDQISQWLIDHFPSLKRALYPRLSAAFGCKTHLTCRELVTLYRLAKGKAMIAEIGSYLGASSCALASGAKHTDGAILCIDTWQNNAMSEGELNTWPLFRKNTAEFSHIIVPVTGWSHDVVDRVKEQAPKLDLLFIDGDHSYEGVKRDWQLYKALLDRDSVVVFHDIGWAKGVQKVVAEDVMPIASDYHSLPNMWWGTINKKP